MANFEAFLLRTKLSENLLFLRNVIITCIIVCIISKVHIDLWQYDLAQFHLSFWCTLVKVVSSSGGNGERRATTDARSSSFWTGAKSFLIQSSYRKVQNERTKNIFTGFSAVSAYLLTYVVVWFRRRLTWVRKYFIWTPPLSPWNC